MPLLDLVPRSFGDYEAAGGGRGLRGRGGAGFPTGAKWRAVRAVGAGPRYAVCNAAEGEPATFKDQLLLRTNPYQVLEGLAIAAYAVGAERAYVGLKETFTTEIQALRRALSLGGLHIGRRCPPAIADGIAGFLNACEERKRVFWIAELRVGVPEPRSRCALEPTLPLVPL